MQLKTASLLMGIVLVAACDGSPEPPEKTDGKARPAPAGDGPGHALWQALRPHCGEAFRGELEAGRDQDDRLHDQPVTMHLRHCEDSRMLIPLHVGDDHSRTWVLERHAWGVSLKHEHRNEDGEPEDVHRYGGLARPPAQGTRLEFPVDDETLAMLPGIVGGVWTIHIDDGRFYYQVRREGSEEVFRLAFDLNEPMEETPPEPWGWDDIR